MAWYRTGTVVLTNGSPTVTGTGTYWANLVQPGWAFLSSDNKWYEVDRVTADDELILVEPYDGVTEAGATYALIPTQGLVATLVDDVNSLLAQYGSVVGIVGTFREVYSYRSELELDTRGYEHFVPGNIVWAAGIPYQALDAAAAEFDFETSGGVRYKETFAGFNSMGPPGPVGPAGNSDPATGAEIVGRIDTQIGSQWRSALVPADVKTNYESNPDTNAFTDADKTKLTNVEEGATADQTGAEITTLIDTAIGSNSWRSGGEPVAVKAAYESNANTNAFTDAAQTKLAGIEDGATADQTGAEITTLIDTEIGSAWRTPLTTVEVKTLYESNADTNAFTDADKTKLAGIEDGATADQTGAEITTLIDVEIGAAWRTPLSAGEVKVLYEGNADTNPFTDALKTKLDNFAGTTPAEIVADLTAHFGNDDWITSPKIALDGPAAYGLDANNYIEAGEFSLHTAFANWANLPADGSQNGVLKVFRHQTATDLSVLQELYSPSGEDGFEVWRRKAVGDPAVWTAWERVSFTAAERETALSGVPVGTMSYFLGDTAPDGYLVLAGQAVSALYPELRQFLINGGSAWGSSANGDPFLPDLRGEMVRGWDNARGIDPARVFGSLQLDALQGHWHQLNNKGSNSDNGGGGFGNSSNIRRGSAGSDPISEAQTLFSDGINGEPRIASETRPRNVALLPCVKAYGTVSISGQADLSALLTTIATQQQAEAGNDDTTVMTPLATRQAIRFRQRKYLRVFEVAASAGGTFTSGAWRTRTLNSTSNYGVQFSYSFNGGLSQLTLAPGVYWVEARAAAYQVAYHRIRVFDVVSGMRLLEGENEFNATNGASTGFAILEGSFNIAYTAVIELQHICTNTSTVHGFGPVPTTLGATALSELRIWEL